MKPHASISQFHKLTTPSYLGILSPAPVTPPDYFEASRMLYNISSVNIYVDISKDKISFFSDNYNTAIVIPTQNNS